MIFLRIFIAILPLLSLMCGPSLTAGGTTDTGNARIIGRIVTSQGSSAVNVTVKIRPHDYLKESPADSAIDVVLEKETVTDTAGYFMFDSMPVGDYFIEANNGQGSAVLMKISIDSSDYGHTSSINDTLRLCASLSGFLGAASGTMYISIMGLDRCVKADSLGYFFIADLPAGVFRYRVFSEGPSFQPVLCDSFVVNSGQITAVQYACWRYSKRVAFNTTSSGANTTADVYKFPVLVRLTSDIIDFSAANGMGNDIRFVKSDNTSLPYEIERWDSMNNYADIWVLIDTIFANNSSQYVTMYWGNPNAAAFTNSASVFDTANGFCGVWHLDETSGTKYDATCNKFDGTEAGTPVHRAGHIVNAVSFDDSADFIEMGNVLNPQFSNFTISIWIKRADTAAIKTIIAKSVGGEPSSTYGWLIATDSIGRVEAFVASDTGVWGGGGTFAFSSSIPIADSASWHHVAVVFDRSANSQCKIFIDGVDVSSNQVGNITGVGALANAHSLRIASEADGGYTWKGCLDEVAISFAVRSSDWIKLCYMNQKSLDALVQYR